MTYIGNTAPSRFSSVPAVQRFSGNNSTTAFTLATAIGSEQEILVSVDGVIQDTANYTVSGTTLTFSPAPSAGTNNIFVFTLSRAIASVTHPSTSALSATSGTFSGNVSVGGDLDVTGSLDMSDANLTNVGSIQLDSIAGDADTNTTIAFPGSDIITLGTAGSERVRINASGNVGIGIDSPDGKVHIHTATAGSVTANAAADELVLENSGDAGLTILSPNANNSQILLGSPVAIAGGIIRWTGDDNAVKIGTNNSGGTLRFHVGAFSEVMRISSAGNVGIGTTSPSTMLHLSAGVTGSGGGASAGITMTNKFDNPDNSWSITPQRSGVSNTGLQIRDETDNRTDMVFDGSGRVGILETSPAAGLHITSTNNDLSKIRLGYSTSNHFLEIGRQAGYYRLASFEDGQSLTFGTSRSAGATTERMRIDADGRVMIGTTTEGVAGADELTVGNTSGGNGITIRSGTSNNGALYFSDGTSGASEYDGGFEYSHGSQFMRFISAGSERMRLTGDSSLLLNKTADDIGTVGVNLAADGGYSAFTRSNDPVLYIRRNTSDGVIINLMQDGGTEGSISVSGSVVSYNSFSGSHWSRLTDNSKPTILKGTIIETIDEMCDWYRVKFTIAKTEDAPERIEEVSVALPSGKSVGDTMSYTHEGITYDNAVILKEEDEKHPKCKISDTVDSKRVYGVYMAWDNDDDTVNDMYVTAVGTHVVRINKDVSVQAGDLLSSNGDGTAKVQDDDIIRSKTIGKVLTNIKQETYSDGSYTVPCALYCG